MAKKDVDSTRSAEASPKNVPKEEISDQLEAFDPTLISEMRMLASSGLNPESIVGLLAKLFVEVPAASKENMDRIKVMDKLLNTARSMMETTLKHEKAAAIMRRLDELEDQMERVAAEQTTSRAMPREVWQNRESDE